MDTPQQAKESNAVSSDAEINSKQEDDGSQLSPAMKKNQDGVVLIPQPSDDPRDPLNWTMQKKLKILAVISFATFAGFSACLAGQLQVEPQAELYNKTTTQIAYQNSAGSAGMAAGGFFFFPLSHVIGRSSAIFWSLIGAILSNVWAALMTHESQYNAFIVSRFFGAFFGAITGVLGPRILVDLFFLHQRGRAFTVFHWCFDFGTVAGPTLSALISAKSVWMNAYRWTAGLVGLAVILVFLFLHETSWDRTPGAMNPDPPSSFIANRIATFLPGTKVTPKTSFSQTLKIAKTPFLIAISPVCLVLSIFTLTNFGFYVAMNSLSPTFLQKPVATGGYGFTTWQNAEFSFTHWIGIFFALFYGQYLSDRLPFYIAKKYNNGIWVPEYRLHALWFPGILNPIGLGLFGAGLLYHLHWVVLALATVLVTFGSLCITPITVNYINECFIGNPAEASIAVNFYRVGFGLSVAFYIKPWVADVNVGWTYGTMAFLEVAGLLCIALLVWKGHRIREMSFSGLGRSEEGEHVVEEKRTGA
ncbi:putative polyamine transporter protein [Botrytis fragariae]|uniref:Putative polyamine transporter protein n=1 Tax=Botrytis fragariae TaxID=1964551 RepID=A0A8H6AI50_9HELO|nr:putative polyamine transporter protein [Botrytis fragariae]KAF5868208.1 putative polyamine transporter protein [Botrytis fragariae]